MTAIRVGRTTARAARSALSRPFRTRKVTEFVESPRRARELALLPDTKLSGRDSPRGAPRLAGGGAAESTIPALKTGRERARPNSSRQTQRRLRLTVGRAFPKGSAGRDATKLRDGLAQKRRALDRDSLSCGLIRRSGRQDQDCAFRQCLGGSPAGEDYEDVSGVLWVPLCLCPAGADGGTSYRD